MRVHSSGFLPFVTANLYEVLLEQAQDHDGAAPRIGGHWEPLIAVYRREPLITLLEKNLKNNNIRLSELCSKLDVIEVDEQALEKDNIALHSFMNINKPEDLEKALVLLQ